MMYNGNLELHPDKNLNLSGWVHSNANVYVGNGSTDPSVTPASTLTFSDRLTYQGDYSIGFDPLDGGHAGQVNVASPTTPASLPPGHEQYYSLFGWDQTQFNTTDGNPDNDGYHEMIDKPSVPYTSGASTDPFKDQPSECARARPELDHGFGILQVATAEHRLRERRRTGHECSDAGRFPQKGAEELQPFRQGGIEFGQKADGGCTGAVTARPRPDCIKIVHAFRRANPRQDIFRLCLSGPVSFVRHPDHVRRET